MPTHHDQNIMFSASVYFFHMLFLIVFIILSSYLSCCLINQITTFWLSDLILLLVHELLMCSMNGLFQRHQHCSFYESLHIALLSLKYQLDIVQV